MSSNTCGGVNFSIMQNELSDDYYHGLITLDRCTIKSQCSFTFDDIDDLEPNSCLNDVTRGYAEWNIVDPDDRYIQVIKDFAGQFVRQVGTNLGSAIATGALKSGETFYGRSGYVNFNITLSCYSNEAGGILTYYSTLLDERGNVEQPVYGYMNISSSDGGSLGALVSIGCGLLAFKEIYDKTVPAIDAIKELVTLSLY